MFIEIYCLVDMEHLGLPGLLLVNFVIYIDIVLSAVGFGFDEVICQTWLLCVLKH